MTTGNPAQKPARGSSDVQNYLPAWSPDGTKIAFTSSRDGNQEIYYVNRDGSGLRRVTNSPSVDVTPDLVPHRAADCLRFRSHRAAADLRREHRRDRPEPDHQRNALRPPHLVSRAVQRDCLHFAVRRRPRHPRVRVRHRTDPHHDRRQRQQRESGICAERPAHRVRLGSHGARADLHHRSRRQEPAADHQGRSEPLSRTGRNSVCAPDDGRAGIHRAQPARTTRRERA